MKTASTLLICLFMSVLAASTARAEVEIGKGFTCSGTSVLKDGQEIPYTKAKSNVTNTLKKLKSKIKSASKKKKAGLRQQLQDTKNAKTLLKACSNGELDPGETEDIFARLSSGTGTFSGDYNGVVDGFIPLSGDITLEFSLDGTVFSATMTLGGNLGNALDAQPLSFSADVGGVSFPAQFFLPDTFLGEVTLSISEDGHLSVTNANSDNATIDFEGDFSDQSITGDLTGSYSGHSFGGDVNLTRS